MYSFPTFVAFVLKSTIFLVLKYYEYFLFFQGASIIRMLQYFLGKDVFLKGLNVRIILILKKANWDFPSGLQEKGLK